MLILQCCRADVEAVRINAGLFVEKSGMWKILDTASIAQFQNSKDSTTHHKSGILNLGIQERTSIINSQ